MANKTIAFNVYATSSYKDEDDNEKTRYTQISVAFKVAKDGLSLTLNALPVNGQIVLFPPKAQVE